MGALSGLYLALGPSLALETLETTDRLVGGSIIFALCGAGAAASFLLRRTDAIRLLVAGSAVVILGVATTLLGVLLGKSGTAVRRQRRRGRRPWRRLLCLRASDRSPGTPRAARCARGCDLPGGLRLVQRSDRRRWGPSCRYSACERPRSGTGSWSSPLPRSPPWRSRDAWDRSTAPRRPRRASSAPGHSSALRKVARPAGR
jgi:hypothetical protein